MTEPSNIRILPWIAAKSVGRGSEATDEPWGRYLDKDGDGIPYRTLPGNRQIGSAYFARGTSHDSYAKYTKTRHLEANMDRIKKNLRPPKLPAQAVIETVKGAKEA